MTFSVPGAIGGTGLGVAHSQAGLATPVDVLSTSSPVTFEFWVKAGVQGGDVAEHEQFAERAAVVEARQNLRLTAAAGVHPILVDAMRFAASLRPVHFDLCELVLGQTGHTDTMIVGN